MATMNDDIKKLEMAAEVILAPPDQVTAENRREAERIFMEFRENLIPFDTYRQILESTQNHFVMFEVAQVLAQALLRQWHSLTEENVISVCQYLIQFPASRPGLPNFVVAEMLRSFAIIVKRGSVDMEILNSDFLANAIEGLIRHDDENLQRIGLQAIEAITSEFSTNWRSSHVSLSWDFNARAKKHFEHVLLKNFLKLSLSTLSQLLANSDFTTPSHIKICEKFLHVALIVFSWNFSQKLASIRLRALATIIKTSSFRPPITWADFFQDASIVNFFAQLHARVRHNEELAVNSLNCMAQVASVMGDVLGPTSDDLADSLSSPTSSRRNDRCTHDLYVQTFASKLIELFQQLHEYEMQPMSVVVYKLFTYHPIVVFKRFPPQLMANFVVFLAQKIVALTGPAMEAAIVRDEHIYHESLHNLYQAWRNLIRNSIMFSEEVVTLISTNNVTIVEVFLKSIMSYPYGDRKEPTEDEICEENEEEADDRTMFMDIMLDIGYFSQFTLDMCTEFTISVLDNRIRQFRELGTLNAPPASVEDIRRWQEDIHWIFLFMGYQFQQNSFDSISNMPEQMAQHCLAGYRSGRFVMVDFGELVQRCLDNPFDASFPLEKLDPVSKMSWYIFSWSVLEHNALTSLKDMKASGDVATLISPELTCSSLWLVSRLIAALSPREDVTETSNSDGAIEVSLPTDDAALLPQISSVSTELLSRVIDFFLRKVFGVLSQLPGEKKLCEEAVELIVYFADYRADALARCDYLYKFLGSIDLSALPSGRQLIKSLVLVGSMVSAEDLRTKMYKAILSPLESTFTSLCAVNKSDQGVVGRLAGVYYALAGVAEAIQSDSAQLIFEFLKPVFNASINLLIKYPECQLLTNAVLEFYRIVTDVLFFYIEGPEDCALYHKELLSLIDTYRNTQTSKYRPPTVGGAQPIGGTLDELECQTKDLCMLMDILSQSLSKTYMPTYDGAGSVENSVKVAVIGLELILPLMDDELLKIPTLCMAFFRLILFMSDLAPRVLSNLNETMNNTLMHCLNLALDDAYGTDRLKCALEIVNNLTTFLYTEYVQPKDDHQPRALPLIAQQIVGLLPKVFATALQYGGDSEVFPEASNSIHALICLDKEGFAVYVGKLLERPENACNLEKIKAAFQRLLPANEDDIPPESSRLEKRNFRERFEKFLTEIYGLLYL